MAPGPSVRAGSDSGVRVAAAVLAPDEGGLLDGGVIPLVRARGAVMIVSCRGAAPPWTPSPETLTRIADGLRALPMAVSAIGLGHVPSPIVAEALASIADAPADPRRLALAEPGGSTWSIPQGWIGRHLIAVVPCVVDPPRSAGEWHGPIAALLCSIAEHCGVSAAAATAPIGAAIAATAFAGATIVVDAGSLLARATRSGQSARVARVDRRVVMAALPASASWWLDAAAGLAGFLARKLDAAQAAAEVDLVTTGAAWPNSALEPVASDGRTWDDGARVRRRRA